MSIDGQWTGSCQRMKCERIKAGTVKVLLSPVAYLMYARLSAGRGVTEAVWAVGFCLGSGLFGSCNSD